MGSSPEICSLDESVVEELIVGYTAGSLDSETELGFERHLKLCSRCRRLTAQQNAVWSALDSWQPHAVSPDFDRKLAQRIEESQRWFPRLCAFAKWIWRPALPLAVCALAGGVLLFTRNSESTAEKRSSAQIEQRVEHALDDMEMLKQIGVDVTAEHSSPSQKI